jgi:3-phenylpropionate/trans-cinnamate dioxygenase ferredoxin reductase subunit
MSATYVIVGASLAAATAAATLRQEGFDGEVILIGDEDALPYERPALSKQYLRGEMPFEKVLVRPAGFYEQQRIELDLGVRAVHVEVAERRVELNTGQRLRYDKLLIATGVRNRRLQLPGVELGGVFDLRTVEDAQALGDAIGAGRRAVVVGLGFIGCEVAASLRAKQVEVVGIEPAPTPLFHVLGQDIGRVIAGVHREHGVETIFDDRISRFEGDRQVARVVTERGRRIDCDFAIVGVGVEPAVDFLAGSGIAVDNGIVVDEYCRSSVEDVYAAGDVTSHYHPTVGRHIRVAHWQNAIQQGVAAARAMLGKPVAYDPVHWFWSDQYDLNLQYAGFHLGSNELVMRGSLERRGFLGFFLNDEKRIEAVIGVNRGKDLRRAMPLIKAGTVVDPRLLEDEDVDLRSLVHPEATGAT